MHMQINYKFMISFGKAMTTAATEREQEGADITTAAT